MKQQTNEAEIIDEQCDSVVNTNTQTNTSEQCIENETVNRTVEVVEWSAPDSLGNQYVVRTVRTTANIQRGVQNDKETTVLNTTNSHSTTANHTERIKTETVDKKTYRSKQTETETPVWVHTTILGIIVVIAIIVLSILKRYRIL